MPAVKRKYNYSPVHIRLPDDLEDALNDKALKYQFKNIQDLMREVLREWNNNH